MRSFLKRFEWVLCSAVLLAFCFSGCSKNSYSGEKLKDAIADICRNEYGIENIDVKIIGTTIGVYLPLEKLFAADFKEAAVNGKVRNLESLFEPSPEALEKVEDVLFTISRVILSTDLKLEFYVLQATDVEKTGMQLILTGYVDDVKRVRIWDISREEYRKRVIHELKLNRASRWNTPVKEFFKDIGNLNIAEIQQKYFGQALPLGAIQTLFFNSLRSPEEPLLAKSEWQILQLKSAPVQRNEVLVYAKVIPGNEKLLSQYPGIELQYLFMLAIKEDDAKVARIIPFQYLDKDNRIQKIPFPPDLQIEQNVEKWEEEFKLEEVKLGSFLAAQLNRRVQAMAAMDERIQNTFRELKAEFEYQETPAPAHFELNLESSLTDFNNYPRDANSSLVFHEDMLYLLNKIYREFVNLLRSYQFGDYDYVNLKIANESTAWMFQRDKLESFRKNKIDLQGLLSLTKI